MEEFIDTSNNINQNWWRSTKIGYSQLIEENETSSGTSDELDFEAKSETRSENSVVATHLEQNHQVDAVSMIFFRN